MARTAARPTPGRFASDAGASNHQAYRQLARPLHCAAAAGDDFAVLSALSRPMVVSLAHRCDNNDDFATELALAAGVDIDAVALGRCVCRRSEDDCVCLGYAPLHCAAESGSATTVNMILDARADPNVRSGRVLFGVPQPDANPASMLIGSRTADAAASAASIVTAEGLTPLHVAAACGHVDVVKSLLERHADPCIGAVEPRQTAFGFASGLRNRELNEILRRAGAARVAEMARDPCSHLEQQQAFLAVQEISAGASRDASAMGATRFNDRFEALRQRVRARELQQKQMQME